jgi:hypothetical protein
MTIGDIASLLAALAALITVYYAHATVIEARKARQEATSDHLEEMRQAGQLLEAIQSAHRKEMEERGHALARELWLQRLTQLGRVQELAGEAADIARLEIAKPPPSSGIGTWTRMPGALRRLKAALEILELLGGPALDDIKQTTINLETLNTPPQSVVPPMMNALEQLMSVAANHQSFQQPPASRA